MMSVKGYDLVHVATELRMVTHSTRHRILQSFLDMESNIVNYMIFEMIQRTFDFRSIILY